MKRISIVLLMLLVLCGFVFASGKSEDTSSSSDDEIVITYAFWGSPDAIGVEADVIAAFEAKYPNIHVEPVVSGYNDYHTKLLTMIAGGSAPDVMRISTQYLPDLASSGGLLDIGAEAEKRGYDLSMYYEEGVEDCSYEDICYGLPWGTAPVYMLVNVDMFEEAGIPLPSYDWTIEEFDQIVRALSKGEGEDRQYGFAMEIQSDLYPMYPYVWANGGDLLDETRTKFTFDQPEAYEAIQMIADLYQDGCMPPETLMVGTQTASVPSWFINDKVAMFQGTAANILTIQQSGKRFEVWPLPSQPGVPTTVVKSNATAISKDSKNLEAAWLFATFARGDEGESLYMEAKRVPPSIKGEKYWDLYLGDGEYPTNIQEVTDLVFGTYGRLAPVRKGYLELEQLLTPICQNIMLGNTTAKEAMTEIAPNAQAILDRSN